MMIPTNYHEWRQCIEIDCGIALTPAFAEERIKAMQQANTPYMLSFKKLYGEAHAMHVVNWYQTYLREHTKA